MKARLLKIKGEPTGELKRRIQEPGSEYVGGGCYRVDYSTWILRITRGWFRDERGAQNPYRDETWELERASIEEVRDFRDLRWVVIDDCIARGVPVPDEFQIETLDGDIVANVRPEDVRKPRPFRPYTEERRDRVRAARRATKKGRRPPPACIFRKT